MRGISAAAHSDLPAILFDDFRCNPEAQAGSSFTLGSDKGFEYRRQNLGRDTRSIIGNGEPDAAAGALQLLPIRDPNPQASTLAHSVRSVPDNVGKDLAKLPGGRKHRGCS
jgi:hypothetical protein